MPDDPIALDRPYCTLDDVQKETRNDDSEKEDWFRECINRASRAVEDYAGIDFLFHDHATEALTIRNSWVVGAKVYFPWPVLTLTELAQEGVAFDAGDFAFEGKVLTHVSDFLLTDHKATMTAKGTFGFPLATENPEQNPPPTVPPTIRRATVILASAWTMWNRREVIGYEGARESLLDSRIPKEFWTLINSKRRLNL